MEQPTDYLEQAFRGYQRDPAALNELRDALVRTTSQALYVVGIPSVEHTRAVDDRPYQGTVPYVFHNNELFTASPRGIIIAARQFDDRRRTDRSDDAVVAYSLGFNNIRDLSLHSTRVEMARQLWALYP